jgi:spore germination cell wall hydrolase CwlJ-like protein
MRYITLTICSLFAAFIVYTGHAAAQVEIPIAPKVHLYDLTPNARQEVECLAQNMYFEAGGESESGQLAVAFVTHNRSQSGLFPESYCDVVKQRVGAICQFSWYCEKRAKAMIDRGYLTVDNNSLYNRITQMALSFYLYTNTFKDPTKGAMFFHANYVKPMWSNMKYTAQIGRHLFYTKIPRKPA